MLVAERQALGDAIGVGMVHLFAGAEIAAAASAFALQKVAFTSAHAHDFTGCGYFEPFRYRFLCLNAFRPSHKNYLSGQPGYRDAPFKRAGNIDSCGK